MAEKGTWCLSCERIHSLVRVSILLWENPFPEHESRSSCSMPLLCRWGNWDSHFYSRSPWWTVSCLEAVISGTPRPQEIPIIFSLIWSCLWPPQTLLLPTPEVSEWGSWNKLGLHLQHAMSKGKHRIPSKGLEGTFIQMTIFQSRVRSPPRVHKWIPGFSVIIIIKLSVSILSLKTQQSKLSVKGLPWWSSG